MPPRGERPHGLFPTHLSRSVPCPRAGVEPAPAKGEWPCVLFPMSPPALGPAGNGGIATGTVKGSMDYFPLQRLPVSFLLLCLLYKAPQI